MNRTTVYAAAIYLIDAALFFLIALSGLPDLWKLALCLATLGIGGAAMARVCGWTSYFGINMIKGEYGFRIMGDFAGKHPKLVRFLADVGAGIGYGMVYSIFTFNGKGERKKLAFILFFSFLFSLLISTGSLSSPAGLLSDFHSQVLFAAGVIGGLALQSLVILVFSAINIFTVQNAPAGAQLVIPGVTVPWVWLVGIVIAVIIHEFAHGVLCKAENLRVLGSGVVLFGFLPIGAFVEPDEKRFKNIAIEKKRRILAAGPAANLIAFVFFTVLLLGFAAVASGAYADASAVQVLSVNSSYPGTAQLSSGDIITGVDGQGITTLSSLETAITSKDAGDTLVITTQSGNKKVTIGPGKKLGITVTPTSRPGSELLFGVIGFVIAVLSSTAYLNLAIGAINLVPLFITDGARIVSDELDDAFVSRFGRKRGSSLAAKVATGLSLVALALILVNLALPTVLKLVTGA